MIKCICVDVANKPSEIPIEMWPIFGNTYHITRIDYHTKQGIQGVELHEIKLINCQPYETYRLSRFNIPEESIEAFRQLLKDCTKMNDIDVEELLKQENIVINETKI